MCLAAHGLQCLPSSVFRKCQTAAASPAEAGISVARLDITTLRRPHIFHSS